MANSVLSIDVAELNRLDCSDGKPARIGNLMRLMERSIIH